MDGRMDGWLSSGRMERMWCMRDTSMSVCVDLSEGHECSLPPHSHSPHAQHTHIDQGGRPGCLRQSGKLMHHPTTHTQIHTAHLKTSSLTHTHTEKRHYTSEHSHRLNNTTHTHAALPCSLSVFLPLLLLYALHPLVELVHLIHTLGSFGIVDVVVARHGLAQVVEALLVDETDLVAIGVL